MNLLPICEMPAECSSTYPLTSVAQRLDRLDPGASPYLRNSGGGATDQTR